MKTKFTKIALYSMFTLFVGAGTVVSADDVTGDRLNIGSGHTVTGTGATIAGGGVNTVSADYSVIAGGVQNTNTGDRAFIGGGTGNMIDMGVFGVISGGGGNYVAGGSEEAVIGGGIQNYVSGMASTCSGGEFNTVDGDSDCTVSGGCGNAVGHGIITATIGGGSGNVANGFYSTIPGGVGAQTSNFGQFAYANGSFAEAGDAQMSMYVLRNISVDSTSTELLLNQGQRMLIAPNSSWTFDVLVTGRNANGDSAHFQFVGGIKNVNGMTSFVGTPVKTVVGKDVSTWDATVSADNADSALTIQVTGDSSTIRWVATVRTVEVKY